MENPEDVIIEIREFKQFDIIFSADDDDNPISDHHYASLDQQTNYSSQTTKRIMKEWKILEESLPDSIYVRAYEGRIDLLRAVIIGSSGTPYHDGLFFFDIQFPPCYPNRPPKFHYLSFGVELNHNLYRLGKVCLSIINNTWKGGSAEKWNPSESTVLQVLVSIQALVLNPKPYFNSHPSSRYLNQDKKDYILSSGEKKKSLAYNEKIFVLSYKKMLAVINRPPRHFESFVAHHFRDRAETILTACKAYIQDDDDDAPPIHKRILFSSATTTTTTAANHPKRFQKLMMIIYSRLVMAFIKNGSSSLENYIGSYDMDMDDDKFVEPRLRGEIHLSELILPLFCFFVASFFGIFIPMYYILKENFN